MTNNDRRKKWPLREKNMNEFAFVNKIDDEISLEIGSA